MIKIEKARLEDLAAILRLQYAAYQSEAALNNDFTIQPLQQTLEKLTGEFHDGVILKAVEGGEIIGSVRARAEGDTVYIGKLMVRPDRQGKGLGKRLLAAMEENLHRERFELFTSSKSERNLRLYEKAGYKRLREERSGAGLTLVYMEKSYDDGSNMAIGISVGLAIGAVIGLLTDDIGLWLPIGLCIGVAIGAGLPQVRAKRRERAEK